MILVDTSALIEFFTDSGTEASIKLEEILMRRIPFGITPFIMQEILQGAASEKDFELLRKYLSTQRFYHLKDPLNSFIDAAKTYMKCRRKGITIRSTIDCLVAQTAIEHDLMLLHNDNDFRRMSKVIPLRFY
ncbi:PilT protein domain protein [uncultured Desulfobacterium sp.]|uniref:Ribonuclease VapC n=1 Tax=uncultured Desulfobacterium sp. TaxID=201089 RepID=A0A445MUV3_9BACT|nr:PilT protein domain protein [uncultured Desulfobacterium sp.]